MRWPDGLDLGDSLGSSSVYLCDTLTATPSHESMQLIYSEAVVLTLSLNLAKSRYSNNSMQLAITGENCKHY